MSSLFNLICEQHVDFYPSFLKLSTLVSLRPQSTGFLPRQWSFFFSHLCWLFLLESSGFCHLQTGICHLPPQGFPGGSVVKSPPANAGDAGLIPGLGRFSGEENGNPFWYPCLGNPMDRRTWWATVHVVAKSQTRFNSWACTHIWENGGLDFC